MPSDQIYADLLSHCDPASPPQPWACLGPAADLWLSPSDRKETLAALMQTHSVKDLIECGVARLNARNKLTLKRILEAAVYPRPPLLPLRATAQGKPFDLLTRKGTVSGRLPIAAGIHEHVTAAGIEERGFLCVAFSMPDLVTLRAVGIPVALAAGLEQITPAVLAEFRVLWEPAGPSQPAAAGQTPPTPSVPAAEDHVATAPPRLVFVGWTPSRLSLRLPPDLDGVLHNLVMIGACVDMDLAEMSLWRPTAAEVERIAFCLANGRRQDCVRAFLHSLEQSAPPIAPHQNSCRSYSECRARFRQALLKPEGSPGYRRRRLREFQAAVERDFAAPVLERAAREADVNERSRLAGQAAIHRVLHVNVELFLAKLEREMTQKGVRGDGAGLQVGELLKTFKVLYDLSKEPK